MSEVRLLIDPPAPGTWNMAVDETLLETAAATGHATLRLYEWDEPTLSLGYFQAVADRQQHAPSRDCPLVRRASGGGAILHDRELTYSIVLPQREARWSGPGELYDIVHQTLIAAFRELGIETELVGAVMANCRSGGGSARRPEPFLCFQRRTCSDIVYDGAKIVGSAQRRRRGAVLQHGSILLAKSRFAPELPGIEELAGITVRPADLRGPWTRRLATRLGVSFYDGELEPDEKQQAESVRRGRFAAAEYLRRR
jgi:lipoyl(octanoyl) transferase